MGKRIYYTNNDASHPCIIERTERGRKFVGDSLLVKVCLSEEQRKMAVVVTRVKLIDESHFLVSGSYQRNGWVRRLRRRVALKDIGTTHPVVAAAIRHYQAQKAA